MQQLKILCDPEIQKDIKRFELHCEQIRITLPLEYQASINRGKMETTTKGEGKVVLGNFGYNNGDNER